MSSLWADRSQARRTPLLDRLFDALDGEGIRWSLLRPRETLDIAEGDVDLLVEPAAVDGIRGLLPRLRFTALPIAGHDLHAAAYDAIAGRFLWIHFQPALRLAGEALPAEAVLCEAHGEPRQPSDAWLLWILLLRALVDKGELPERHRPHVTALARDWDGGPAALETLARRLGIEPREAVAAAREADWDRLLGLSPHRSTRRGRRPARIVAALAGLRLPRRGCGLGVAVIGPDGAGKTTLVNGLRRSLPFPTRTVYMGLTGGRLPKADALRIPGLVLAARVVILWVRYAYGAYHRSRGRIVLFERYTLDGAVPSGARLSPAGRLSRRLQRWACPLPDLVLLLDAGGGTLHARSGEYDATVLEGWREAYNDLRRSIPSLEAIDAEQPVDEVRRQAEALIWRRFSERLRSAAARGRVT